MLSNSDVKEIVNRLYKAYISEELKKSKKYRVHSTNYDFTINVDSDKRFTLIKCSKGDFNTINKIINMIPGLKLLNELNLKPFK